MPSPSTPPSDTSLRAHWVREVRARLSSLNLSPTREAEIIDELSQHLEDRYRELIAGGASREEAARAALADFQNGDAFSRQMASLRQAHAPPPITPGASDEHLLCDLSQDVRYALRTFLRQPGFAIAAIVTIALGVGACSAIFSVVRGVLLESLPYKDADRLYRLRMVYPDGSAYTTFSPPDFMSVRSINRVFDRVEAYTSGAVTMLGGGEPEEVRVVSVSDGLFDLLGLQVIAGRDFLNAEHDPGRNGVAILDYGFWQRAFGGDHSALGRSVTIGGVRYAIVGVLGQGKRLPADVPGARVPSEAEVYLPLEYGAAFNAAAITERRTNSLAVLARARTGVTAPLIDSDLARIAGELRTAFPETNEGLTMNAISARDLIVGDVRRPLLMLLGAVGFVLLVACANVANVLLARASARRDELAVRVALGARRVRLLRQLLTEALVLGAIGGTLGLAIAYAGTNGLVAARPADIPRLDHITLDWTVVLFALTITLLASLVFGAVPALQATRHLTGGLRTGGRGGGADRHAHRVRAVLLVAEVALAVVLLVGAGLLLRTLAALTRVAPGFSTQHALSFRTALFGRGYDPETVQTRVTEIESALRRLPGATAAAATSVLPLSGPGPRLAFGVEGAPPPPANVNPEIGVVSVTPSYLKTIGATLLAGRGFTDRDRGGTELVAIVNEAAVRRWFQDGSPLGKRVLMSGTREIVGVVADVLQSDPKREAAPQLFLPYAQRPSRALWFVVRSAADSRSAAPSIRAVVHEVDAELAVSELALLDALHAGTMARPRFYTTLLALFALLALALAVTGIFGVMSYAVAERTREIGIRLALGAYPVDVLRMIVGRAVAVALMGAAIGLATASALSDVIRNQLFGVDVVDPVTLAVVILILLTSVAVASFVPAQRAARLDPLQTLRHM